LTADYKWKYCILDLDNAPLPVFPPNEVIVGVISMEDELKSFFRLDALIHGKIGPCRKQVGTAPETWTNWNNTASETHQTDLEQNWNLSTTEIERKRTETEHNWPKQYCKRGQIWNIKESQQNRIVSETRKKRTKNNPRGWRGGAETKSRRTTTDWGLHRSGRFGWREETKGVFSEF